MIFNHADTEQQDLTLSRGDDYPIHQTPEPVAYAGTDRNFYDRYFFNGYSKQPGNTSFFAAAFGVYPHLNIADAAFVVVRNGVETALHASRCLNMERMDISAGPIRIEVIEPLHKLRVSVMRRIAASPPISFLPGAMRRSRSRASSAGSARGR